MAAAALLNFWTRLMNYGFKKIYELSEKLSEFNLRTYIRKRKMPNKTEFERSTSVPQYKLCQCRRHENRSWLNNKSFLDSF